MRTAESSAVKSASRTLDLLERFATAEQPLSFRALRQILDIPASSLSQLLATLEARGFVEHLDHRGGYRAGPALHRLAGRLGRARTLAELAGPVLLRLRDEAGESAGLNIRNGDETEVIAAEHAEGELVYRIRVGATAPLYAVAAGKAFLADLPEAELEAYLARTPLKVLTEATIRTPEALRRELAEVRRIGFAYSLGEASPGVAGIARLVRRNGETAALTVGLPMIRHDDRADAVIRQALRNAAERLEAL